MERCLSDCSRPISRDQSSPGTNLRLQQAVLTFEIFVIEPAIIAHPTRVDVIVFARRLPIDHVLTSSDDRVAPRRTTCADTLRFLEEPDAHFKAEIGRSQRADGTNVDSVQRIIVIQRSARMRGEHGMTPAIDKPEYVVMRNFLAETDAA